MGETSVTIMVSDDAEEDLAPPLIERFRCTACHALFVADRLRCGSCGSLCTVQAVHLPRAEATIHVTLPYRTRRRVRGEPGMSEDGGYEDDHRGGEDRGGDPGAEEDEDLEEEDEDPDLDEPEDISLIKADRTPRYPTGFKQLDAMFVGGFPRPGVIMIGATPGLGKSRMTAELSGRHAHLGHRSLVVCAEESKPQVAARYDEMHVAERFPKAFGRNMLHLYKTQDLEKLLARLDEIRYHSVFIDSAFMLMSAEVDGQAGAPSQLKHVVKTLYNRAHGTEDFKGCKPLSMMLVAHGTKQNVEAGTNTAKHWIDAAIFGERTDLYGEPLADQRRWPKDQPQFFRLFSTGKNRFGASDTVAHFEMTHPDGIPVERVPPPAPGTDTPSPSPHGRPARSKLRSRS